METTDILEIASELGRGLLVNGAEIYRVENSVRLILEAYGFPTDAVNVFAITNVVIVTVTTADGKPITRTLRVLARSTNLDKVAQLNALSRYLCQKKPTYGESKERLEEILTARPYSLLVQTLAYAFGAGFFAILFQGGVMDGVAAAVIAIMIRIVQYLLGLRQANPLFSNIVCSAMTAVLAFIFINLGVGSNMDKMIIGALMTLVPGMLTTNCLRDLLVGDVVAGLSRMAEAILIATSIAVGTFVTVSIITSFR